MRLHTKLMSGETKKVTRKALLKIGRPPLPKLNQPPTKVQEKRATGAFSETQVLRFPRPARTTCTEKEKISQPLARPSPRDHSVMIQKR